MNDELTKTQQLAYDFYSENPGATRIECCKAIYKRCDVFLLQNLQQVECALRKHGYLFYTYQGRVWDIADKNTALDVKLRVQHKIGKSMVGYLKSNVRILHQATDKEQISLAKEQFKESVGLLVENKIINVGLLNRLLLKGRINQPKLKPYEK